MPRLILLTLSIICFFVENGITLADDGPTSAESLVDATGSRKWITELFEDAEDSFRMNSVVSQECRADFEIYKQFAENQTVWAVQMLESSEWPLVGLFAGRTTHLGNWDSCLRARGPGGIRGRYCLAEAIYNFMGLEASQAPAGWIDRPDESASVWKNIKMYETDRIRRSRQKITWAMCIPASCTPVDLETSLRATLEMLFELSSFDVKVSVRPSLCKIQEPPQYSQGLLLVVCLFVFIIAIVLLASTKDYLTKYGAIKDGNCWTPDQEKDGTCVKLLRCFSVIENYKKLVLCTPNDPIMIFYVFKTFFTISSIVKQSWLLYIGSPLSATEDEEMEFKPLNAFLVSAGIFDLFFIISGYLTVDKGIRNGGTIDVFLPIVYRWLRFIPMIGVTILFWTFIFPHLNEGPLWDTFVEKELDGCRTHWWVYLLTLNNAVKPEKMCFPAGWFVAVDLHLHTIGYSLLLIMNRNRRTGIIILILTFVGTVATLFVQVYRNGYDGLTFFTVNNMEPNRFAFDLHFSTVHRLLPYLLGFTVALVTGRMQMKHYHFSTAKKIFIIAVLWFIHDAVLFYYFRHYEVESRSSALKNAVYVWVQQIGLTALFGGLALMYQVFGFGIANRFIQWPVFVPLGRLSLSMYLSAMIIQTYHYIGQKALTPDSRINMFWWMTADVVMSISCSFLVFLILEAPISNVVGLWRENLNRRFARKLKGGSGARSVAKVEEHQSVEMKNLEHK